MRRSVRFGMPRRAGRRRAGRRAGRARPRDGTGRSRSRRPRGPRRCRRSARRARCRRSAITAKPWFWTVTSTRPVSTSRTGWFAPRWPNGSLNVLWPSASPSSWWPRQMPKSGIRPSSVRIVSICSSSMAGSPGPLPISTARGSTSRIASASHVAGHDVGLDARRREPVRDRALHAEVDDDDARPLADRIRLFVHGSRGSGLPSMNGSASARSRSSSTGASPSAQRRTPPSRILRTSVRVSTAVERDDAPLAQPGGELGPRVAHHDALALHAVGLHPRLVDAVGADQRIREAEHLRDVARVGDGLLVAGHRGREAGLAGGDAVGADRRRPGRRCRPRGRGAACAPA